MKVYDLYDESGIEFIEVLSDNFKAVDEKTVIDCLDISKAQLLYEFQEHKEHLRKIHDDYEKSYMESNQIDMKYYNNEIDLYIKGKLETFCGSLVRFLYPKIKD